MDADQRDVANPYGMDEDCRRCSALCASRERVVHGYGDVGADFLFVGEAPTAGADGSGVPFDGDGRALWEQLHALGLCPDPLADRPTVENALLTHLTRCRGEDGRAPDDGEVRNCEPYLTAEVRSINPEVLVPVGDRALAEVAAEYAARPAEDYSLPADHAVEIRGRGFALVPTVEPWRADDDRRETFLRSFSELMGRDYRQTKGRRGR